MLKHALYCSFLVGMVQYPVAINAQKKLETNITVPNRTIRVDELFDLFSREADLEFSINSKRINLSQMINVTHHSQTVTGWLQDLTAATGISYKIKGDHVILEDQKTIALPVKTSYAIAVDKKKPIGEEKTHHTVSLADKEKPTQKDAASSEEEQQDSILTSTSKEEEKTAQQVEDDKYKEGLISLIKEDLHTVYIRREKKTIDRSIHPEKTDITIVPDSSKPTAPPLQGLIKVDMGIAGIAVGTERRIGQRMMLDLSLGLGGGYNVYDYSLNYTFPGDPMVFLSINPRYYINRNRRAAKGKKTTLNSGSYIGFRLKINAPLDELVPVAKLT